jgi:hypothetical protein
VRYRTAVAVPIAAVVILGASGCASPEQTNQPAAQAPPSPSALMEAPAQRLPEPQPTRPAPTLIGTITQRANGTTLSTTYRLGALMYRGEGRLPIEALTACNANYEVTLDQIAYLPAEVTVSYTQGSLAKIVALSSQLVHGPAYAGVTAYYIDGRWQCQAPGGGELSLTFQPGETRQFPIWIFSQVLTNAAPRVSGRTLASWRFNGNGITTDGLFNAEFTFTGPYAKDCVVDLPLYARSCSDTADYLAPPP